MSESVSEGAIRWSKRVREGGEQARKGSKPESKKRGSQRARESTMEWESCTEGTRQQRGEQRETWSMRAGADWC